MNTAEAATRLAVTSPWSRAEWLQVLASAPADLGDHDLEIGRRIMAAAQAAHVTPLQVLAIVWLQGAGMTDLTQPLWGAGTGHKRHLVAMWCGTPVLLGRCGVPLDTFATMRPKYVEARQPCARCQKIADREAEA